LIKSIFPKHVEKIVEEMSILTIEEQNEFSRLCKKLGMQEAELILK